MSARLTDCRQSGRLGATSGLGGATFESLRGAPAPCAFADTQSNNRFPSFRFSAAFAGKAAMGPARGEGRIYLGARLLRYFLLREPRVRLSRLPVRVPPEAPRRPPPDSLAYRRLGDTKKIHFRPEMIFGEK